jgi:4'-phosphopantetheinyl transferase
MAGGLARLNTTVRFGDSEQEVCFLRLAKLEEAAAFEGVLTAAEREQASAVSNPLQRSRFVVSRGLRRVMLSACTGVTADSFVFSHDGEGKPRLQGLSGWDFNISHAGDYVAVLVGRGSVGVDIEQCREVRDMESIVDRYFHPEEQAAWHGLPPARQPAAFFLLWSAREAAIKCAGLGLAKGLSVTRVDPGIFEQEQVDARVGDRLLQVKPLPAPAGYAFVVCRQESPAFI